MDSTFSLSNQSLAISNFLIHYTKNISIPDPSQINGFRKADFFISFPTAIATLLPASVVLPNDFLTRFLNKNAKLLVSDKTSATPLIAISKEFFSLAIYNGSANMHAISLSQLAVQDIEDEKVRAAYQEQMYKLISPQLRIKSQEDMWIIEDCIATGDTIMGFLAYYTNMHKVTTVRIDAICATTQALLLLHQFAVDNKITLIIHVSYLAYGLSSGEKTSKKGVPMHANYITYPEEVIKSFPKDVQKKLQPLVTKTGDIFVVGDMGDAGKSMDTRFDRIHPWNFFRNDPHGLHAGDTTSENIINKSLPIHIYFANGGYVLRSFYTVANQEYGNDAIYSAKRVWSSDPTFGYGVAISKI